MICPVECLDVVVHLIQELTLMPRISSLKKRPCRVCRCWFSPNPRLKDRQKTCGKKSCQKEWHRRKSAQWNKKNADYFRANYLQKKLSRLPTQSPSKTTRSISSNSPFSGLPIESIQEVIGMEQFIILEYIVSCLLRRYKGHNYHLQHHHPTSRNGQSSPRPP